jgi:hypothetical protein
MRWQNSSCRGFFNGGMAAFITTAANLTAPGTTAHHGSSLRREGVSAHQAWRFFQSCFLVRERRHCAFGALMESV